MISVASPNSRLNTAKADFNWRHNEIIKKKVLDESINKKNFDNRRNLQNMIKFGNP